MGLFSNAFIKEQNDEHDDYEPDRTACFMIPTLIYTYKHIL